MAAKTSQRPVAGTVGGDASLTAGPGIGTGGVGAADTASRLGDSDRSRLLTRHDMERILSMSRSTIARHAAEDPRFPQPARLGRMLRWDPAEVEQYLQQRFAERG